MSNKWYRRMVAAAATVAAGTVVFAAPATADEATVTTDPCNPGTIIVEVSDPDSLTAEELAQILANYQNQNGGNNSQNGSGGDGTIPVENPTPGGNGNVENVEVVIIVKPKPTPTPPLGPIVVNPAAHASAFTAATCGTDDPGVTPGDPNDTGTDLGAVFGSLESVSFGSLEQLLGL
ncbi:hypothetical protein ACFTSD_11085 [Nocardiaceae bacterium NPDC056970]